MSTMRSLFDITAYEVGRIREGSYLRQGLPSGVELEALVPGGVPRGKLTTVFSSEGNFKTTFVAQMAVAVAQAGFVVLNITLEDSASLVAHRFLARLSGVPFGLIHAGVLTEDQKDLVTSTELSSTARNVHVVDDLEPRWERVEAAVRALPVVDLLIVDYIQMLGRDPAMLDNAVFGAQRLAKERNMAVVFVSQRTKVEHKDDNPRPETSNMFGSSALRMGCKVAVGLFRPWSWCFAPASLKGPYAMYTKWLSANPAHAAVYPNVLEVHVTKNFAGPPGAYHVVVEPATGVITPFSLKEYL